MAKLLYIESSPRKERSKSISIAKAFIAKYQAAHPGDQVLTLDLWEKKLPEFDGYSRTYTCRSGRRSQDRSRRYCAGYSYGRRVLKDQVNPV